MKKLARVSIVILSAALTLGLMGSNVSFAAGPATINLGSASNYIILAKTAITTTGVTSLTGDIAISPAFSTDTAGFSLVLDGSGTFSTSASVSGSVYAADYTAPTPATLSTAVSAMEAAYTDGSTRTPGVGASNLNLGGGTLSGHNLVPGTYTWGSNVSIIDNITFTGSASDIWILQISGTLSIEANKNIILAGGALPQNIFWVVAGTTTLKPGSTFNGIILAGPGASTIAMQDGATLYGRALGQTDVTLIGNTITTVTAVAPSSSSSSVTPTSSSSSSLSPTSSSSSSSLSPSSSSSSSVTPTSSSSSSVTSSSSSSSSSIVGVPVVPPLIHVTKVPSPLLLSAGGGMVKYTNKVTNPGTVALTNVRLVDDKCSPVKYVSGDTNSNSKLDTSETWIYTCSANLTKTTTNVISASGDANGLTARDFAIATVVVNATVPKLPNTGLPSENNTPWNILVPASILVILTSVYFARRKQTA